MLLRIHSYVPIKQEMDGEHETRSDMCDYQQCLNVHGLLTLYSVQFCTDTQFIHVYLATIVSNYAYKTHTVFGTDLCD